MYFNSSSMKPIRRAWTSMDVIVSGIGAIPLGETIDRETYAGEHEVFTHLKSPDAVGDICARYFDRAGAFIVDDYYERIVGVPIEELRGAKNNLIMASGTDKAEAIVGVLRTGMVRMLVLDEQTAKPALDLLQAKGS